MICWFEQGLSDSRPEKLTVVEGLGFLPGSVCPHHDNAERRDAYRELVARGEIKAGYGCDGGTSLMFRDTKLDKAVTTDVAHRAVSYGRVGDAVQEHTLSVEII